MVAQAVGSNSAVAQKSQLQKGSTVSSASVIERKVPILGNLKEVSQLPKQRLAVLFSGP